MKRLPILLIVTAYFCFSQISAQENTIKNYPLKDYVAPEIKYRSLDLGTSLNSNGFTAPFKKSENQFNTNFNLNYYQYLNTTNFQGISDARFYASYSYAGSKDDDVKVSTNWLQLDMDYNGQNRFYNQKNAFLGLHGYLEFKTWPSYYKHDQENYTKRSNSNVTVTPYLSGGKGRIQPVHSAREAMDILLSLEKSNRLSRNPDKVFVDSLAKVANRIRYKRFFDSRFKTIYQLEALDKALQNMDLIDTADMIYFASLNDIWNFTQNFKRGSGIRYEGGIVPKYSLYYYKSEITNPPDQNDFFKSDYQRYGLFGFFSFNRMRPVSYAWQSDIMLDVTFGYETVPRKYSSERFIYNKFKALFNACWQFGFYPNTRSYLGITPYSAVSYVSETDFKEIKFGFNSGIVMDAYYYISPRLRLSFYGNFFYIDSFDRSIPAPFWNNATYSQNELSALQNTNDVITSPVNAYNDQSKRFAYNFGFNLRFAIF